MRSRTAYDAGASTSRRNVFHFSCHFEHVITHPSTDTNRLPDHFTHLGMRSPLENISGMAMLGCNIES